MIRFISACEVTEAQHKQGLNSELYERGDMVLAWINQSDLYQLPTAEMEDLTALRAFAQRVMANWPDSDVDGDELQEAAVDCGLLKPFEVTEPCGEGCRCADYGGFPLTCYRPTALLSPETAAAGERTPRKGDNETNRSCRDGALG